MSDFWDWFILLAFTAAHLIANYFGDILSSRAMTKLGIREKFWLAAGKDGLFVEWKGWLLKFVPVALIWSAFFIGERPEWEFDRFWCGFLFVPAIVVSIIMYFHNWRKIKNRVERIRRTGGII